MEKLKRRSIYLEEGKFIPLTFDLMFKKVFGDENEQEPIKYLLKCILDIEVKRVKVLNNEIIGEGIRDKKTSVDLIVELSSGTKIGIEMNTNVNHYLINRNIFYMFRIMSRDLLVGENYEKLNKHIQINFDCEGYHKKPIMKYKILEEDLKEELTDKLEIYRIDVPYYVKKCYNEDTKNLDYKDKFIGLIGISDKCKTNELIRGDSNMEKIYNKVRNFNDEDEIIGAYDGEFHRKEVERLVLKDKLEKATKEVTERVTEEVTQKVTYNLAIKLLKENVDLNIISNATGISIAKLKRLKETK